MNIFTFENGGWNEYVYEDFESFFDDIVQTEMFFMFSNCTKEEIKDFFDDIATDSGGLDDVDYYRFHTHMTGFMSKDDIYVYHDLSLTTFDYLFEETESYFNYLKEEKSKF